MADNTQLSIEHIVSTPTIRGGKPRIDGHRVTVEDVVLYTRSGWDAHRIAGQFGLTLGQVHAALSYYYDHQAAIDRAIEQAEQEEADLLRNAVQRRQSK